VNNTCARGNSISTYEESSMVEPEHIKEIDKQLKKLGSKVEEKCLDGEKHALARVLNLACGGGKYGLSSLNAINTIGNDEFSIKYTCQNSPTRAR
jgi:hypothetical protein